MERKTSHEVAAAAVVVACLSGLAWWAHAPGTPVRGDTFSCAEPLEVVGPDGRRGLACSARLTELEAVLDAAGAGACRDPALAAAASLARPALIRLAADCAVVETRDGMLSGEASLLLGIPIDVNRADACDLEALSGIGPKMAARIVADREERGPYCSIEELDRVRGVGLRTVEKLRGQLRAECR
jgi:competence ComEA-like helix-hairpin-helix protein